MKKYVTLNKKWKEILFAASGFGPNLLMILMGAYFTDAVNPAALPEGSFQAIGISCYILPMAFPILWALAKAFDGLVDIPLAALTDGLKLSDVPIIFYKLIFFSPDQDPVQESALY